MCLFQEACLRGDERNHMHSKEVLLSNGAQILSHWVGVSRRTHACVHLRPSLEFKNTVSRLILRLSSDEFDQYMGKYTGRARRSWSNSYCCQKWIQWPAFKSLAKLFIFHITQIILGKVWIKLFSLQLLANSRAG